MKLILIPLIVMFFISVLYTLIILQPVNLSGNINYNNPNIVGQQNTNGSNTTFEANGADYTFITTMALGLVSLIIAFIVVGVVAGIRVLGSGLSDFSVQVIYKSIGFYSLWAMLSVLGLFALNLMPYSIGYMIYFVLTLIYTVGVLGQISSGSGGN